MSDVDVVVVGSRCAGAPLATLLARRGLTVRLFDKARFPSDTASTHIIQPRGAQVLADLGVMDSLTAAGAIETRRLVLAYEDARIEADYTSDEARARLSTGARLGINVRRTILDDVLLRCAVTAGVDVRPGTPVTGLLRDRHGRVCGVRVGDESIPAAVVVGADGRRSSVSRFVGAQEYATYPAPRLAAWGYFENVPDDATLRIGRFGRDAYVANPTDNGVYVAGFVPDMTSRAEFLADRERLYADGLARWRELRDVIGGARRIGPLRVVADWHGYFRDAAGPGWVLVGDAGHFKDPAAAQGITDALRQAQQLAEHLTRGLDGGSLADETAAFWRWRDEDCRAMHWFAADMGAAGRTRPITTETVRDVARTPGGPPGLLQLLNRDITPRQLLDAPRLVRSTVRALGRTDRRRDVVAEMFAAGRAEMSLRASTIRDRRRVRRTVGEPCLTG